jgi:ABC-type branched-subunit amino acid transport system substrate-binding protein
MHRRLVVSVAVAITLALGACGTSAKTSRGVGGADSPTTAAARVESTAPGTGVTATTIKLGISLVDFSCIAQFVDSVRENQQQVYQAFIDDINARGGIDGRRIVADFKSYCPLSSAGDLNVALCTSFADDDKVFAVLGNLTDAANDGSAETCLAKKHHTVVITYVLTQQIMSLSPPGMIIYPGTTPERQDRVLLQLLKKQGTLTGKKVGVLAEAASASAVKKIILPGLKQMGAQTGTAAYLTVVGSDTTAAQAQLSSFIERWKSEGVNALYVTGEDVATQQFMEKVSQGLPGITLMTDVGDAGTFAQSEQNQGVTPNPYAGMLDSGGFTAHDYDTSANWKYCAAIYKKYTGHTAPDAETKVPGPKGKTLDTNGSIIDACRSLTLFHDIATRVGKHLNAANWVAAVDNYGAVVDRGGGTYASLTKGKYDIADTFQLQSFDPTIPPSGNWKSLSPYENIPG